MLCYRDITFCPFYMECAKEDNCGCALTPEVQLNAEKWWGNKDVPICVYSEKPSCFERG